MEDRRVVRTRRSIEEAFLALRKKKALERITVRELCDAAGINKSTFYTHYRDIYDLSDAIETQIARDIVGAVSCPEAIFDRPDALIGELRAAFDARDDAISTVFSGSRAGMLIARVEQSLKEAAFALRPDLSGDAAAGALFTFAIYGSYYAYTRCAGADERAVTGAIAQASRQVMAMLPVGEK